MKIILIILTITAMGCANEIMVPAPGRQVPSSYENHPQHERYLATLSKYRSESRAPGAIMSIKKPAEDFWAGATGYSNLEHNTMMNTTTKFRTGSITKMFTAVVILKLAEQGKVSLEDKLTKILPETLGHIPDADQVTVRHLLAHLSGIADPPNESLRYQADLINDPVRMKNMSVDQKLQKYVYGEPLHFTPGTRYAYSNTNYWLLGKIAERIEEKPTHQLMRTMIFQPLSMADTYLGDRDDIDVARGYTDLYGSDVLVDVTLWDRAEGDGEADGGLISTARDLTNFMYGLFRGDLLSKEILQDMVRIQLESCNSPECEYGLGIEIWRTGAGKAYGHNGGLVGIDANVLFYEDSGAVSVLYKNEGRGWDKSFMDDLINR